jgi:ABC-type phosphate/phosphonate transport system ATPase subunit
MAKREPGNPTREKNPAAVALSKLGAAKGGVARAKKLSATKRSRIARLGAKARWAEKTEPL